MPSGPDIPRCGARKKNGEACQQDAGWGTPHSGVGACKHHGGSTPSGIKAGRRKQAEQAVATYGLPRQVDPHSALLEELHRTAGAVTWLGAIVGDLPIDQVTHLIEGRTIDMGDDEPTKLIISETVSVWVQLYQTERRHLESIAKTCITCGIAERQVQLAEQQGHLMGQIVDMILTELGVRDRPEVPDVVRRAFTLIPGGLAAA